MEISTIRKLVDSSNLKRNTAVTKDDMLKQQQKKAALDQLGALSKEELVLLACQGMACVKAACNAIPDFVMIPLMDNMLTSFFTKEELKKLDEVQERFLKGYQEQIDAYKTRN